MAAPAPRTAVDAGGSEAAPDPAYVARELAAREARRALTTHVAGSPEAVDAVALDPGLAEIVAESARLKKDAAELLRRIADLEELISEWLRACLNSRRRPLPCNDTSTEGKP